MAEALPHGVLAVAALAFLVLKYRLISSININWDEFLYLSQVHEYARGELASAFQTFHVHLFRWVASVSGNEIDQMLAARRAVFVLRVGSTLLVGLLGYRVAGRTGAVVAALATLTFSNVLRHGEAFRADPLISFLFLLTVTLLLWRHRSVTAVVVAALAFAVAANITVKTALYVPALLAGAAVLFQSAGPDERRLLLHRGALFVAVGIVAYAALHLLHAAALAAPGTETVQHAARSGAGMLGSPQHFALEQTLSRDWPFWLLFFAGVITALVDGRRSPGGDAEDAPRTRAWLVLSMLLPMASLAVYRNSYPYFYVTLVPLASLACGYAVARISDHVAPRFRPVVVLLVSALLVVRGWQLAGPLRQDHVAPQRAVIDAVRAIFPQPVHYIDRGGMVASFPRLPPFMSTYVMSRYRERGVPMIPDFVRERQPRFVLGNVLALALEQPWNVVERSGHSLLREDFLFLQGQFVHHWGPVWVAGKRLTLSGAAATPVDIVIAGQYTVEATAPVTIDGTRYDPDAVVTLSQGTHSVTGSGELTLRIGAHLHRPAIPPPQRPLFLPL